MAEKSQLAVGQRVKFFRMHDKATQLTGKITEIHEDNDLVNVVTEVEGRAIEVETNETVHANDVTPIPEVAEIEHLVAADEEQADTAETQEEPSSETGAESRPRRRRYAG